MAVMNFRIGNDLVVLWAICNRDGSPYNLANKQVRLFVMNERGRKEVAPVLTALPDGTINNVIRWDFLGMEQRVTGLYTLSVEIFTDADKKSIKKDYCEAFCLVGSSSLEDEDLADNISDGGELTLSSSLDVIQLTIPRVEIGTNGNWIIDGIDTNVSALGGGPGLVNKIYDYLGFGKTYDPESVIDTFNAHAINTIYERVQDAVKDIRNAESAIDTLESDVELLKQLGGGGTGGGISEEQLAAIMEAIGKKADKTELNKYILLSAASQTIKGDITIDGNLVVKGDAFSEGQFAAGSVGAEGGGSVGAAYLSDLYDVSLGSLLSGDILSWNGNSWVNIKQSSLVPDLSAYATKDNVTSALSSYLPLSGGTLSGDISIVDVNGESTLSLGTKGSVYYNESDEETALYNNGSGFPSLKIKAGIAHPIFRYNYANYDVLHSGNIGSQSVAYASNAGNADTLDGYHAEIMTKSFVDNTDNFTRFTDRAYFQTSWVNMQGDFCSLVVPTWSGNNADTYYLTELRFENYTINPKVRNYHPLYGATKWYTLATLDDTVASAYRLVTPDGAYMIHLTDYTLYIGDNTYISRETNILGKSIALRYGASAANGLVLNQSGNVLIGTTTDNGAKLQVSGTASASRFKSAAICIDCDNDGNEGGCGSEINNFVNTLYLQHHSAYNIVMATGGGNVGIGTYNPQATLDVAGTVRVTDTLYANNGVETSHIIIGGIRIDVVNGALRVNGDIYATGQFAAQTAAK